LHGELLFLGLFTDLYLGSKLGSQMFPNTPVP